MMITVLSPGSRTLVEDGGRIGYEHLGVPTSGAADHDSLMLANTLVGNTPGAAAFEVALSGPTLRFDAATVIAYTGADTDLFLDDRPVPALHTVPVRAGQTLTVGTLRGGVYGYLAVRGGIDVAPVLGSRSSCTLSGLGPARLNAGEAVTVNDVPLPVRFRAARLSDRPTAASPVVRYLTGPHAHLFSESALARFGSSYWEIAPNSSRVGVRLSGPVLETDTASLPSLPMVTGAVQVPPNGLPIVLGPDHGTTGGYPVIAVVIEADLPTLMQRLPGSRVRFAPVTLAQAASIEAARAAKRSRALLRLDEISR